MKRIAIVAAVAVVAMTALVPIPAQAHHRRPPAAKLVTGDTTQWGRLGTYCWSYSEDDEGVTACADATYGWPRAKQARSGALARIRFRAPACPSELDLTWWAAVGSDDAPVGTGEDLDYKRKTMRRGGEVVACRVWFRLPSHIGHMYLDAWTVWDGPLDYAHGTSGGGDADYTFHLRLSP